MFKIKTKVYGDWVTLEKVYGSKEPALFSTYQEAYTLAQKLTNTYDTLYKVVSV